MSGPKNMTAEEALRVVRFYAIEGSMERWVSGNESRDDMVARIEKSSAALAVIQELVTEAKKLRALVARQEAGSAAKDMGWIISSVDKPESMTVQDELAWALGRVLKWPLPDGTVEQYYLPRWLTQHAYDALNRYVADDKEPKRA